MAVNFAAFPRACCTHQRCTVHGFFAQLELQRQPFGFAESTLPMQLSLSEVRQGRSTCWRSLSMCKALKAAPQSGHEEG